MEGPFSSRAIVMVSGRPALRLGSHHPGWERGKDPGLLHRPRSCDIEEWGAAGFLPIKLWQFPGSVGSPIVLFQTSIPASHSYPCLFSHGGI